MVDGLVASSGAIRTMAKVAAGKLYEFRGEQGELLGDRNVAVPCVGNATLLWRARTVRSPRSSTAVSKTSPPGNVVHASRLTADLPVVCHRNRTAARGQGGVVRLGIRRAARRSRRAPARTCRCAPDGGCAPCGAWLRAQSRVDRRCAPRRDGCRSSPAGDGSSPADTS
jgi:hypothetical protein